MPTNISRGERSANIIVVDWLQSFTADMNLRTIL